MSYLLTKSNPNKWRLKDYLRDLDTDDTEWYPEWWSDVCKDTKPGDTLFIGVSGEEAGIYAKATIASLPCFRTIDEEYAVPPGSAKQRLGADIEIDSFRNLIIHPPPVLESDLLRIPELKRIARWLHIQGAACHLTEEEGEAIDRLIKAP